MSTTNKATDNSTVNSQITDSLKAISDLIKEQSNHDLNGMGYQVMTQAAGMAMLNIVNQQQQLHILQNTVVTVAAKAMLESNPEEAVKLMEQTIANNNVAKSIQDLKTIIDDLNASLEGDKKAKTSK